MLVGVFLCATCSRDRGCSVHPVFPAPSVWRVRKLFCKARAQCAARSRSHVSSSLERSDDSVRRSSTSEGGSNPYFPCGAMDCFADARNDGFLVDRLFENRISTVFVHEGGRPERLTSRSLIGLQL